MAAFGWWLACVVLVSFVSCNSVEKCVEDNCFETCGNAASANPVPLAEMGCITCKEYWRRLCTRFGSRPELKTPEDRVFAAKAQQEAIQVATRKVQREAQEPQQPQPSGRRPAEGAAPSHAPAMSSAETPPGARRVSKPANSQPSVTPGRRALTEAQASALMVKCAATIRGMPKPECTTIVAIGSDSDAFEFEVHTSQRCAPHAVDTLHGRFVVHKTRGAIQREAGDGYVQVPGAACGGTPRASALTGKSITNAVDGSVMVLIPAGRFLRGSPAREGNPDERPQRGIHLDIFYIDRNEVTAAQYEKCVRAHGCTAPAFNGDGCTYRVTGREDHPMNCVDWQRAWDYCAWAGKRLPTEAEWEKAARGASGRTYPWGNEKPTCARTVMDDGGNGCGKRTTWPVGSKSPQGDSPYGAQDMAGNVWEWVNDWYGAKYYEASPASNPLGPASGRFRVLRGGSWYHVAEQQRTAYRYGYTPTARSQDFGFRCARKLAP